MTLQEAKDQIAKGRNWQGWDNALVEGTEDELLCISDQAAELYTRKQINAELENWKARHTTREKEVEYWQDAYSRLHKKYEMLVNALAGSKP